MSDYKITTKDIKSYDFLFTKAPSLVLGAMIRKKTNLVAKFESTILSNLGSMNEIHQKHLNALLNMDIDELQVLLKQTYNETHKKQYKQLANPKAKEFLEINLAALKKLIEKNKKS